MSQTLPSEQLQQPGAQKNKHAYTWRWITLIAVLCGVVVFSGTAYLLSFRGNSFKPPVQPVVKQTQPIQSVVTPTPTVQPTATPTLAPIVQPTSAPPQLIAPNQIIGIASITMTSATTGWGYSLSHKGQSIVRTTDGGKTWYAYDVKSQEAEFTGNHIFLDDKTAWVIMHASDNPLDDYLLMHTTDGGNQWKKQMLPPRMTNITFTDAQNGWAWAYNDSPDDLDSRKLYRTIDGGETWDVISTSSTERDINDTKPGPLPLVGNFSLSFQTPLRGWAVLRVEKLQSMLLITQDGGATWQRQNLSEPRSGPIPGIHSAAQAEEYFGIETPRFTTPQEGVVTVTYYKGEQGPRKVSVYRSTDGGLNWTILDFPFDESRGGEFAKALDWRHVVTFSHNTVTMHMMGENQWMPLPTFTFTGDMYYESLSFIDGNHGWFGTSKPEYQEHTFTLYETTDGGLSWHEVMSSVTLRAYCGCR